MGVGRIAAIVAQTPVGALVDRTTAKRALVIAAAVAVTAAAAQVVMVPVAYIAGAQADSRGRKLIVLVGFAVLADAQRK